MQQESICTTGIPACVLPGLGDGDFQSFHSSRGRIVSIQIDDNLALLVILVLWQATAPLKDGPLMSTDLPRTVATQTYNTSSIVLFLLH